MFFNNFMVNISAKICVIRGLPHKKSEAETDLA